MRALLVASLLLIGLRPALACSAFLREGPGGPVVGKSYDWHDERGLGLVNKRGMEKRMLVLAAGQAPAAWRSRLASLTFNQYGRELPNGGLNEAGLAVEVLVLPEAAYPAAEGDLVAAAFADLDAVRFEASTQWQIVYELGARRVHFRSRRHPAVKTVALGAFSPGCGEPVMMLDVATDRAGDAASAFVPYREEANRTLVEATLRSRRDALPAGTARRVADHSSGRTCSR